MINFFFGEGFIVNLFWREGSWFYERVYKEIVTFGEGGVRMVFWVRVVVWVEI